MLSYLSMAVFICAVAARAARYSRMPVHLRWELYPVAHETERLYGGSYLENLDWWTKPRRKSLLGELKFMGTELFLFKLYYKVQKRYWYAVYPFHIGGFILLGWVALLFAGAMTAVAGMAVAPASSAWGVFLYYLTLVVGIAGFALTAVGSVYLLVRRSMDSSLRRYTAPVDYFNLLFVLAIAACGLASWYFADSTFATARQFIRAVFTNSSVPSMSAITFAGILLAAIFLIYMPFTRMMHYVAKFFTFHMVRWDDEPSPRGQGITTEMKQSLSQPINWSAEHIQPGKTWAEAATKWDAGQNVDKRP